jgi:large subunit ribosomal protein L25
VIGEGMIMDKQVLKTEPRKLIGRKVKKLRREGFLPANVYGKKVKSKAVKVVLSEFQKVFEKAGETGLISLSLGKSNLPVLIHNVQLDPVSDRPLHADFYQVNLKEKVTAQIPVDFINESPAEKQGLGTVVQHISEIQVEALPTDLPDKFELDLSRLSEVDSSLRVSDVKVGLKKVEIKEEADKIIVKVEPLRREEEAVKPADEEKEEEEAEEGMAEGEKGKPSSETVAEGEKEDGRGAKEESSGKKDIKEPKK